MTGYACERFNVTDLNINVYGENNRWKNNRWNGVWRLHVCWNQAQHTHSRNKSILIHVYDTHGGWTNRCCSLTLAHSDFIRCQQIWWAKQTSYRWIRIIPFKFGNLVCGLAAGVFLSANAKFGCLFVSDKNKQRNQNMKTNKYKYLCNPRQSQFEVEEHARVFASK